MSLSLFAQKFELSAQANFVRFYWGDKSATEMIKLALTIVAGTFLYMAH